MSAEFDPYPGDWVQDSLDGTAKYRKGKFVAPQLGEFHRRCCAILSKAFRTGVYNLSIKWEKAEFRSVDHPFMTVTIYAGGGISTWDFDPMTRLVIAAHDECIRIDVEPVAHNYLRIYMHQRQREGGMSSRHPTIEQAVEAYRGVQPPAAAGS
jgi:hypothetical protein